LAVILTFFQMQFRGLVTDYSDDSALLTGEHRVQVRVPAQESSTVCGRRSAVGRALRRNSGRMLRVRRDGRDWPRLVPAYARRREASGGCSRLLTAVTGSRCHLAIALELRFFGLCGGYLLLRFNWDSTAVSTALRPFDVSYHIYAVCLNTPDHRRPRVQVWVGI